MGENSMYITTEIVAKNRPLWALQALALFPFDRSREYQTDQLSVIRGTVVSYLQDVTYKERNTTRLLGNTHTITEMERVIIVSTKVKNTAALLIIFSDKKPVDGECAVCGCTEQVACFHPEHGACWWVEPRHILCSHCGIPEIADDPKTLHPTDRQANGSYKIPADDLLEKLSRVKEFHYVKEN